MKFDWRAWGDRIETFAQSPSQAATAVFLAFIGGILLFPLVPMMRASWLLLAGVLMVLLANTFLLFEVWKKSVVRLAVFIILAVFLGCARFELANIIRFSSTGIAGYLNQSVSVRGFIDAYPNRGTASVNYRILVDSILRGETWQTVSGRILVTMPHYPAYAYGDRVLLSCSISALPATRARIADAGAAARCGFSATIERLDTGRGDLLMSSLFRIRDWYVARTDRAFPEPHAGLLIGILIGERSGIAPALTAAFRTTGTSHLLSVSGYNVSIITYGLFSVLASLVGRKRAFWITLLMLGAFIIAVGANASVVRAGIMGAIALLGGYLGRDADAARLLISAAVAMVVVNPWLLGSDLSFQLSFAATLGLLILSKSVAALIPFIPSAFGVRAVLAETTGATLATLPLILTTFGTISLITPLANIAILLLTPSTMLTGFLATLFFGVPVLGFLFTAIAWVELSATMGFVEMLARIPYANLSVPASIFPWVIMFTTMSTVIIYVAGRDCLKKQEHEHV